jgi:hypothetical protein
MTKLTLVSILIVSFLGAVSWMCCHEYQTRSGEVHCDKHGKTNVSQFPIYEEGDPAFSLEQAVGEQVSALVHHEHQEEHWGYISPFPTNGEGEPTFSLDVEEPFGGDEDPLLPQITASTRKPEFTKRSLLTWSPAEVEALVKEIRAKLKPRELKLDENGVLEPHQFLHLHHMKTGGTSIDHLLKCGRERLEKAQNVSFGHFSIHECARGSFKKCLEDSTDPCRSNMDHAGTMSFCSALKHLDGFGWDDASRIQAMTVLRHPVERVWSMFRFETRQCYQCMNLTDIYNIIDERRTQEFHFDSLCMAQLANHETANLLTTDWPEGASDDEIVAEAIENLKTYFTVIGLTEELTLSAEVLGAAVPWVNKTIPGSVARCSLPHSNSSPDNNHCIRHENTGGGAGKFYTTHWDLPDHPDEATRAAIEAHNQLDLRLYEAAVQYFALQKRAHEANQAEA